MQVFVWLREEGGTHISRNVGPRPRWQSKGEAVAILHALDGHVAAVIAPAGVTVAGCCTGGPLWASAPLRCAVAAGQRIAAGSEMGRGPWTRHEREVGVQAGPDLIAHWDGPKIGDTDEPVGDGGLAGGGQLAISTCWSASRKDCCWNQRGYKGVICLISGPTLSCASKVHH